PSFAQACIMRSIFLLLPSAPPPPHHLTHELEIVEHVIKARSGDRAPHRNTSTRTRLLQREIDSPLAAGELEGPRMNHFASAVVTFASPGAGSTKTVSF